MTPLEAIRSATSENARVLGLDGATGAIQPGRLADLLVFNGDPTTEIAMLGERSRIQHVLVGGVAQRLEWPAAGRSDPPGWRVSTYGSRVLSQTLVDDHE